MLGRDAGALDARVARRAAADRAVGERDLCELAVEADEHEAPSASVAATLREDAGTMLFLP